jgi:hypothetical protein
MSALEKIRAATASMFYVVWSIIGIALLSLAILWAADPPAWSTPDVEPVPDLGTPAPYDTSSPR